MSPTGKSFRFVHACVQACMRTVWVPSGFRDQIQGPLFSLFPSALSSFLFSLVWVMYKMYQVYTVHKMYKGCEVYTV